MPDLGAEMVRAVVRRVGNAEPQLETLIAPLYEQTSRAVRLE
jgi:hypothetical protein